MSFTIYGPAYSTYVRSVRLLLEEKGAAYELVEVDTLAGANRQPAHLARNPFGQVPAFAHDDFELYETDAILRYLDKVAPGRSFVPADPKRAARMDQIMGIIDAHAYAAMIGKVVIQRMVMPMMGGAADEAAIRDALPTCELCLQEFERVLGDHRHLADADLSLADVLLAPIMAYFSQVPEGQALLAQRPRLEAWWHRMAALPSMARTAPKLG